MKKIFVLSLLLTSAFLVAQNSSSFGVAIGSNVSSTDVETIRSAGLTSPQGVGFSFGGYYNYNLNDSFGVIGNLTFNSKKVNYSHDKNVVKLNYLDINPMLKFDVNKSYGKGFFLKTGLRFSSLLSANDEDTDTNVKNSFNGSNFALNFAFGTSFLKYFEIESLFDYSLNNTLKSEKSKLYSISVLINIDISKMITK